MRISGVSNREGSSSSSSSISHNEEEAEQQLQLQLRELAAISKCKAIRQVSDDDGDDDAASVGR